jgi:ubiquinol-cytochrome c reductase cytochrome b subunit
VIIKTDKKVSQEEFRTKADSDLIGFALWGIFAMTLSSGIFLAVYYIPTLAQAFSSVERLEGQVPFGWLIRRVHSVGGNFFLILIFLYLLRDFYRGEYKIGSRAGWVLGVLSLFLTVWTNFCGSFLPLSQAAFWGASTVLSNLSSIPWFGSFAVDFIRGGRELGSAALVRLYSIHLGFSAIVALLLFWRRRLKFAERKTEGSGPERFKGGLFAAAVAGILLACITFIPGWFSDSLKEAANPMINPERVSPPWYFLFLEETLKFIARDYPSWSLALVVLVTLLVFFFSYLDRGPERSLLHRPAALGLGAAFLVVLVYFTLLGTANARYGEKIILPDKPLSAQETRGALVFTEKNCAYCHQVAGREGRREGPDMIVLRQRQRSPEWVQRFILNARVYQPGTTMPRYEIPLGDLEALSAYLLSLGTQENKFVAVDRKQFLDYWPFLQYGGAGGEGTR